MDNLSVAQALAKMDERSGEGMGNIEMFPSSAVAQSHAPGSAAHISTLQQPPAHGHLSQHHQRTSSILQNPSFDNKHSSYRSAEAGASVNLVKGRDSQPQVDSEPRHVQHNDPMMTSTNTATSSAMMVDEAVAAPVAKTDASTRTTDPASSEKDTAVCSKSAEASTAQANEAESNPAVRKVR